MIVGIDFDNTIINYDELFAECAIHKGWLTDQSLNKKAVKQALIDQDGDDRKWQILQAEVYGKKIIKARLFAGVYGFIQSVLQTGAKVYIVSHKTEYSNFDGETPLIKPAVKWLEDQKIVGDDGLIPFQGLSFHATRVEKINRIIALNCDLFIDDLSDVLLDSNFPASTVPILFSNKTHPGLINAARWHNFQKFYRLTEDYDLLWLMELSQLKHSLIINISPSRQGGNNLSQIVHYQNGEKCVVKWTTTEKTHYLKNEYHALVLLNAHRIKCVAKPLLFTEKKSALVQSYLDGHAVEQINNPHLDQVIQFILLLETLDQKKIQFKNIGTHRKRLSDYSDAINVRWQSIQTSIGPLCKKYPVYNKVMVLLQQMTPLKANVLGGFEAQIRMNGLNERDGFPEDEKIFNPSDFGFHNILQNNTGVLQFLDFEYFVYDDKAKMICDFIHHAGHALTIEQKLYFLSELNKRHFFTPLLKRRVIMLINLIGFEWLLIILNVAQQDKLKQKVHANPMLSVEKIVIHQCEKAEILLSFFHKNRANHKELYTLGINQNELNFN